MSKYRDLESAVNGVSGRVRGYVGEAADRASDLADRGRDTASDLAERSRKLGLKWSKRARQTRPIAYLAEDFADEANYQYRRLRRQVKRHPATAVGIAAVAVGTFLLLRHIWNNRDE
ncbi:hypothetical protein [Pinirhizobacter sp.]|uniref:hypothetical protein n=1 Tax=Pinirhizobacter sp. TaxID=2950432 RepID=UPI002F413C5A